MEDVAVRAVDDRGGMTGPIQVFSIASGCSIRRSRLAFHSVSFSGQGIEKLYFLQFRLLLLLFCNFRSFLCFQASAPPKHRRLLLPNLKDIYTKTHATYHGLRLNGLTNEQTPQDDVVYQQVKNLTVALSVLRA